MDSRQHQRNFTERLRRLGFLHISFIDKQGKPRYNYNLYSLRKRFGTEVYKATKCPEKTRIMLRQRDRSCRSVWSYIDIEQSEQTEKIMGEVYKMGRGVIRPFSPVVT